MHPFDDLKQLDAWRNHRWEIGTVQVYRTVSTHMKFGVRAIICSFKLVKGIKAQKYYKQVTYIDEALEYRHPGWIDATGPVLPSNSRCRLLDNVGLDGLGSNRTLGLLIVPSEPKPTIPSVSWLLTGTGNDLAGLHSRSRLVHALKVLVPRSYSRSHGV
jgi:hypothetical protein